MKNIYFFILAFAFVFPFALVGAWYIKTNGIVYFVTVKPLSRSIDTKFKSVGQIFKKETPTTEAEGTRTSYEPDPGFDPDYEFDPDFDPNAALEKLEAIKRSGNFTDPEVQREFFKTIKALKEYELRGGFYR